MRSCSVTSTTITSTSLARDARSRDPIYLSSRSSNAARRILADMGFHVHPLVPGVAVRFGDLEVMPFSGDHVSVDCGDEWDTLPFLVRSTDGHGSFFSMVDISITQAHVEWAAAVAMRPGVISWTNNAMDWSHMANYLSERVEGTQQCFMNMGVGHKLITTIWGTPAAMVMCAGGFSFHGDHDWLNHRVFCVDTEQVCESMTKMYRKEKFRLGHPGSDVPHEGRQARVDRRVDAMAHHAAARDLAVARSRRGRSERLRARDRQRQLAARARAAPHFARRFRGLAGRRPHVPQPVVAPRHRVRRPRADVRDRGA